MNTHPFETDRVACGDCLSLLPELPDHSVDVVVTSPPYWGQRLSDGLGVEADPREYLNQLTAVFAALLPKLKNTGIAWVNVGDAYNTAVEWVESDSRYSTLGRNRQGLPANNTAYIKPRAARRAFVDSKTAWLTKGQLLGLPFRLVERLCDAGWCYRGEVVWHKFNALPEGRCRRPHRRHEPIYLLAKSPKHSFRVAPPVPSVWSIGNDRMPDVPHFSRFPEELPLRCIQAYGEAGADVVVCDPFAGSGTTGVAALRLGCSFVGFEIDPVQAEAANQRLEATLADDAPLLRSQGLIG